MKTVLYLKGSEKSFHKLKQLHETGELTNILGHNILEVREYDEQIESSPPKPEILESSVAPASVYSKMPNWFSWFSVKSLGWAFSAILVLVIGWLSVVHFAVPENPNTTYQIVLAQKTSEMETGLYRLAFDWEQLPENLRGDSPTMPLSPATQAFGAGVLTGREALLENSNFTLPPQLLPPTPKENWSKTKWKDYFELGRWILLLWSVSQSSATEMPKTFWETQKQTLAQLQAVFVARLQQDSIAKDAFAKLKQIATYLEKLPAKDQLAIYDDFNFELEKMMRSLGNKSSTTN